MNKKIITIEDLAVLIEKWFRVINERFDRMDAIFERMETEGNDH